jgi:hypothetical protein
MSSLSAKDRVSLCSFTFSDGRRCRTPRVRNHPHFCFYHAANSFRINTYKPTPQLLILKHLRDSASPLDATLTKNQGEGGQASTFNFQLLLKVLGNWPFSFPSITMISRSKGGAYSERGICPRLRPP